MAAEKKITIQEEQGGETVVDAFKEFAGWKVDQSDETNRITDHSMKRYDKFETSKEHRIMNCNKNISKPE